ncbi:aspartic peptidase domain-containing protein [Coniochaeta sp. 2T2.1]|nr:aspartic peptidase domain-containing protein [Coniochaeta sp. 2T2.1]
MPGSRLITVSSLLIAVLTDVAASTMLPHGVVSIPMNRIVNYTAYGIDFMVGTPGQRNVLKVDTGSPTIGFENPRSNDCQQSNHPCAHYGSYDNLTSSTSVYLDDSYTDLLINHAVGSHINDTLRFADVSVSDFLFGTWDHVGANFFITAPDTGILGLGQICDTAACDLIPTFVQQLFDRGVIGSRAFSVYLGRDEPHVVGTLLLNGVDKAKQSGTVHTIPMKDPASFTTDQTPNIVNYTSFTFANSSGSFTVPAQEGANSGFLDTGNPYFSVDQQTFEAAADYFGIDFNPSVFPDNYPVDCSFRKRTDASVTTTFAPGVAFTMTMDSFVTLLDDGKCVTYLSPGGPAFGDAFLRSMYVVFDIDNAEVRLSYAAYTEKTDVVAVK